MSFFNNTGVDLKEHDPGSVIAVGTAGKFTFVHGHNEKSHVVDSHEVIKLVPRKFEFAINVNHSAMTDEEIEAYINDVLSDNPSSMYEKIKGTVTTYEWNHVCDTHMRTYMVVPMSEIAEKTGLKRSDAIHRRACKACAFSGHCSSAPRCGVKHTTDETAQVYFKMGQDKIIDTEITIRTRTDDTTEYRTNRYSYNYNTFYDSSMW